MRTVERTGGGELGGDPRAAAAMSAACAGSVLTLGIDANSTSSPRIRSRFAAKVRQDASVADHLPPSIDSTWPVIQPACSEAKNSTPCGDVVGRAEALERDAIDQRALPVLAVRLPLPLGRRVRAHEAGRDVVDGDAPRPELVGELAREADLRRLRRRVGLDAGEADAEPGAARDVDDPSAARRLHAGRHRLREVERAGDVDVEDRLPVRRRDLLERPADLSEHAAGVVHQNVDAARTRPTAVGDRTPSTARLSRHVGDRPRDTCRRRFDTAPRSRAARRRARRTPRRRRRARRTRPRSRGRSRARRR